MIKIRTLLAALSLSFIGCGTQVPNFPEVWQCGYSVKFNKFRCVNTKTKEAMNLSRDDSRMEAAQCMSVNDYKASEHWVSVVKSIAEQRCK